MSQEENRIEWIENDEEYNDAYNPVAKYWKNGLAVLLRNIKYRKHGGVPAVYAESKQILVVNR